MARFSLQSTVNEDICIITLIFSNWQVAKSLSILDNSSLTHPPTTTTHHYHLPQEIRSLLQNHWLSSVMWLNLCNTCKFDHFMPDTKMKLTLEGWKFLGRWSTVWRVEHSVEHSVKNGAQCAFCQGLCPWAAAWVESQQSSGVNMPV